MKAPLFAGLCLLVALVSFAQAPAPRAMMPPLNRATLPEAARNLPLERLSSGALMLLNRNDNLVRPSSAIAGISGVVPNPQPAASVALDSRIDANVRLGDDPPQLPANMRAQAEPFIARSLINDAFLVATFQEGRFASEGGAVDVGYSASPNGGVSWSRALIPGLTMASGGPFFRATDPVVAFDLSNNVYFSTDAATDANFSNGVIAVSKLKAATSTFAAPVVVYRPPNNSVFPDKEWIAVNTFPATSTFNRVVVTWTLFSNTSQAGAPIVLSYSTNGGVSWSPVHNVTPAGSSTQGSQPVFLPNGNLAVVYWNFGTTASPGERLEVVISTDGGVTFGAPHRIANTVEWNEPSIRSGSFLPSVAVDRITGALFVVYQTVLNGSPRIAFTKSINGGINWTTPIAISNNPAGKGVFNPAINVEPGGKVLTAVFYDHRNNPNSNTLVDMYLALSHNGGASWQPNIRLTDVSTDATRAPLTTEGYMLGDYLGVAQSTRSNVPAVPVWCDARTGNPDPFTTRASADFTYYILRNPSNNRTALDYLRNSTLVGGVNGPTLPPGWTIAASTDFNGDGQPDYVLFHTGIRRTAIWYLSGGTLLAGAYGPTLPPGWSLIEATDFNGDGKPDFVLFNPSTRQSAVWYLNGAILTSGVYGPTLPAGWTLRAAADFNGNRKPDFLLYNPGTRQTAIWYLNGAAFASGSFAPSVAMNLTLNGIGDFNGDGKPDYVLLGPGADETTIWLLNGTQLADSVSGPTIPAGYTLAFP